MTDTVIPTKMLYSKIEEAINKSEKESADSWLEKYGNETYNKIATDSLKEKSFVGYTNLKNDSDIIGNAVFIRKFQEKYNIRLTPVQVSAMHYSWYYKILKPEGESVDLLKYFRGSLSSSFSRNLY